MQAPSRRSVDLSAYPDLVVVYLGFLVTRWRGLLALLGVGRGITAAVSARERRALGKNASPVRPVYTSAYVLSELVTLSR